MVEADLIAVLNRMIDEFAPRAGSGWGLLEIARDLGPVLTAGVVGILGLYFTNRYNESQSRIAEVDTLHKFLPHLHSSDYEEVEFALMMIHSLGRTDLLARIAEHTASVSYSAAPVNLQLTTLASGTLSERRKARRTLARVLAPLAGDGKLEQVERLLDVGIAADGYHDAGVPLVAAIMNRHWSIAELLIENGADVDLHRGEEATPLIAASSSGKDQDSATSLAHKLLERGANPNLRPKGLDTPLVAAAAQGVTPIVELLLERGADFDGRGTDRQTALMRASRKGSLESVEALLGKGARIDLRDRSGRQAIAFARSEEVKKQLGQAIEKAEAELPSRTTLRVPAIAWRWLTSWL